MVSLRAGGLGRERGLEADPLDDMEKGNADDKEPGVWPIYSYGRRANLVVTRVLVLERVSDRKPAHATDGLGDAS